MKILAQRRLNLFETYNLDDPFFHIFTFHFFTIVIGYSLNLFFMICFLLNLFYMHSLPLCTFFYNITLLSIIILNPQTNIMKIHKKPV